MNAHAASSRRRRQQPRPAVAAVAACRAPGAAAVRAQRTRRWPRWDELRRAPAGASRAPSLADVCAHRGTGRSHLGHRVALHRGGSRANCSRRSACLYARPTRRCPGPGAPPGSAPCASPSSSPARARSTSGWGASSTTPSRSFAPRSIAARRCSTRCCRTAADGGAVRGRRGLLDQTGYTQPALYALQVALAALWQSLGHRADGGHRPQRRRIRRRRGRRRLQHRGRCAADRRARPAHAGAARGRRDGRGAGRRRARSSGRWRAPAATVIAVAARNAPGSLVIAGLRSGRPVRPSRRASPRTACARSR